MIVSFSLAAREWDVGEEFANKIERFFDDNSKDVPIDTVFSWEMFSELKSLFRENGVKNLEEVDNIWDQNCQKLSVFQYAEDFSRFYDSSLQILYKRRAADLRSLATSSLRGEISIQGYWSKWKTYMFFTAGHHLSDELELEIRHERVLFRNLFTAFFDFAHFKTENLQRCVTRSVLLMAVTDAILVYIGHASKMDYVSRYPSDIEPLEAFLGKTAQQGPENSKLFEFLRTPSNGVVDERLHEAHDAYCESTSTAHLHAAGGGSSAQLDEADEGVCLRILNIVEEHFVRQVSGDPCRRSQHWPS